MKVTTRAEWGWDPATPVRRDVTPLGVTWHYPGPGAFRFATHAECLAQVRRWDAQHRARGSNGLEYCGVVCQHGYFIEARSTWAQMIARPGSNGSAAANSIRVAYQFMAGTLDAPPTDAEYRWMGEVTGHAREQGAGLVVDGHRDHYATACPGLPMYENLRLVASYATPAPPSTGDDDLDATQDLRLAQAWDSVTPGVAGSKDPGALYGVALDVFKLVRDLTGKVDALSAKVDALTATPPPVEPPAPQVLDARDILTRAGWPADAIGDALGVGYAESEGFVDAVGDYTQLADPLVAAKWGPSVGGFQVRTLVDPLAYAVYDRVRDIGTLAGRPPRTELAPDATTVEAAAIAQAAAALAIWRARGWGAWSVHPASGKDPTGQYTKFVQWRGKDYTLRLGHPEAARWNMAGTPA